MIEREFIAQKTKEFFIKNYIESKLNRVGISQIKIKKIPLGEKIIISTSRPSLIVGSKGSNIKELTKTLKKNFELENPQIEINEVKEIFLDAQVVAERIANSLERFGSSQFKGTGYKIMGNVIGAGALGVEVIISGKIPGSRARSWRFYQGYLKKCGDVSVSGVKKAKTAALLKSGIIGIKVAIMPPGLVLPDNIEILSEPVQVIEEVQIEKAVKKKTTRKKKTTKKSEIKEKAIEETVQTVNKKEISEGLPEKTFSKSSEESIESQENNETLKSNEENKEVEITLEELKEKTKEETTSDEIKDEKKLEELKSEKLTSEKSTDSNEEKS